MELNLPSRNRRTTLKVLANFGGSYNHEYSATEAPDNSMIEPSRNVRIIGNSVGNRKGYSSHRTAFTTSGGVLGLASFLQSDSSYDRLVMAYNGGIYVDMGADEGWVLVPNTMSDTDNKVNFVNFSDQDQLFIFNGSDTFAMLSRTALTFASAPTTGDTSENLGSNWTGTTGDYPVLFSTGDYRLCTLTNGANTCAWTGALPTGTFTTTAYTYQYTEPTTGVATFNPEYGRYVSKQLWVAGDPDTPNTLYYSDIVTSTNPEKVYAFASGNAGNAVLDRPIKGIGKVRDSIIIFTATDVWYANEYDTSNFVVQPLVKILESGVGLKNARCVVEAEGIILFLTDNNKIRYITEASGRTGLMSQDVSSTIDDLMETLSDDQSSSFGYFYEPDRLVKFWLTQKNETYPNICLILDLNMPGDLNKKWIAPDSQKYMGAGVMHKGSGYIGSSTVGKVYVDESGYADAGSTIIPFKYYTKKYNLGSDTIRKEFREVRIYGRMKRDTILKFEVYIDGADSGLGEITVDNNDISTSASYLIGSPPALGSKTVGGGVDTTTSELVEFRKIIPFRRRGYDIQFIAKNSQTASLFEIKKMEIQYIQLDVVGTTAQTIKL